VTRKAARRATVAVAVLGIVSCATDQAVKAWEENHRDTFLPGYTGFSGDVDGTDDGYVVMSYLPPANIPAGQVIARVRAHIIQKYPCYQVVSEAPRTLVLRCPGGRTRFGSQWDEEYRFLWNPRERRLYMLALDSVDRPRYKAFAQSPTASRNLPEDGEVEQGDEADEAEHIGASQLIPSVRRTVGGAS
jgi:hypothetical protein